MFRSGRRRVGAVGVWGSGGEGISVDAADAGSSCHSWQSARRGRTSSGVGKFSRTKSRLATVLGRPFPPSIGVSLRHRHDDEPSPRGLSQSAARGPGLGGPRAQPSHPTISKSPNRIESSTLFAASRFTSIQYDSYPILTLLYKTQVHNHGPSDRQRRRRPEHLRNGRFRQGRRPVRVLGRRAQSGAAA